MKSSPSLYLFGAALLGAYWGLLGDLGYSVYLITASILALVIIFVPNKAWRALLVLTFCSLVVAGLAKFNLSGYQTQVQSTPKQEGIFEGIITDLTPTLTRGKRASFAVSGAIIDGERIALPLSLTIYIRDGVAALPIGEGDRIRINGKIRSFKHALSPGEFDPFWFGFARGIHGSLGVHDPFALAIMQKQTKKHLFADLRHFLREKLLSLTTPREASVILALMIGDIQLFDIEQRQIYRNIGAGHLLAISGLQISLLAYLLFRFFHFVFLFVPFVGRRSHARIVAAWLSLGTVWLFTLLCGAPPSATRAAGMASILLIQIIFARQTTIVDAFGAAGLCTVLLWPASAMDPSFLLSYAAVFGLIVVAPRNSEQDLSEGDTVDQSRWQQHKQKLLSIVSASVAAGLMTMPISAYLFGEIAPFGLIANIVLIPIAVFLQTPAIFFGMLGALFSSEILLSLASSLAGFLEAFSEMLGAFLGKLFRITLPSSLSAGCLFLAAFFLISAFWSRHRVWLISFTTVLSLLAFVPNFQTPGGARITVLPVGQGDAAVFEFPSGEVMLIDGGGVHDRSYDPGLEVVIPFLERRGIGHIDVMVLSHPDADHLLGLLSVINRISVGEIWHSGVNISHPLLFELLRLADQKQITTKTAQSLVGSHQFGATRVEVLGPSIMHNAHFQALKTNDTSLVLRVHYGNDSALWPGDLEHAGEQLLLKGGSQLISTVVKAPHHGSKTSSTPSFVAATQPEHVIFCTKDDNMWGFPHSQIVKRWQDRGAHVWNTAFHGEITIWLTGRGVHIKAFNERGVI